LDIFTEYENQIADDAAEVTVTTASQCAASFSASALIRCLFIYLFIHILDFLFAI